MKEEQKFLFNNRAWLSLVEHLIWDQGVAGSNPVARTRVPDTRYKS